MLFQMFTDPSHLLLPIWRDKYDFNEAAFKKWENKIGGIGEPYPDVVLIGDATEVFSQQPSGSIYKKVFYSNYKGHETLKVLLFIDARGKIAYVSEPYGGRISDQEIVVDSLARDDFLRHLWRGAGIMLDKGFATVRNFLTARGFKVVEPPRVRYQVRLANDKLTEARSIAVARIHVERAIARAKHLCILTDEVPIISVPNFGIVIRVAMYMSQYMSIITDADLISDPLLNINEASDVSALPGKE
jgi:hypothetical protein